MDATMSKSAASAAVGILARRLANLMEPAARQLGPSVQSVGGASVSATVRHSILLEICFFDGVEAGLVQLEQCKEPDD
jgi:hypothetical protein